MGFMELLEIKESSKKKKKGSSKESSKKSSKKKKKGSSKESSKKSSNNNDWILDEWDQLKTYFRKGNRPSQKTAIKNFEKHLKSIL
jgi:hypothetical protein